MTLWTLIIAIVCGIAIAQGIFLGVYVLVKDRGRSLPPLFLSIMLLGLSLRIGKSYFYYVFSAVPLWGTALAAAGLWAVGPSLWLYTVSSKPYKPRKADYLHYAPTALLVLGSLVIDRSWPLIEIYNTGAIVFALYVLASFLLFWKGNWNGNRRRFLLFGTSVAVISLIFVFQSFFGTIQSYAIGTALALVVLYCINFMIMRDRSILNPKSNGTKKLNPDTRTAIVKDLEALFQTQKIYRQKGLTLSSVSSALDHPVYLVSQTIKEHYGTKFNTFVNTYRVAEVKDRLKDLEANAKIEVIATAVGFSSTSSLYQAFKEEMKVTPQAFRKQQLNQAGEG
ncbi:helix-turn-helix domain-containing protein [Spongiimicrobium sp. 3-5]|uniref:helix-turn-helix domain-containing protein n=1 Tax=Spongiimicrobium sp. 3-5 TaxID=3332596 RepID=UPI00398121C0